MPHIIGAELKRVKSPAVKTVQADGNSDNDDYYGDHD